MLSLQRFALAWACLGVFAVARPAVAASANDGPADPAYADGWQAGDNGGSGFEPWTFAFSGDPSALAHPAPQFIDTPPALPGNALGAPAFALTTSDRASFFDTSEANRRFTAPLVRGDVFTIQVDGSALKPQGPPFSLGNTVQLLGPGANNERFALFTNNQFLDDHWVAPMGQDTTIPAGNAFKVTFTLKSTDSYDLVLGPASGVGAPFFTQTNAPLTGTAGTSITGLRISNYGTGSSADGSLELFFSALSVVGSASVVGDFNDDRVVNATDIDLLCGAIHDTGSPNNPRFDLTADGLVNMNDLSLEVNNILDIEFGDTDTDGDVDLADLGNLATGFGQLGEKRWSRGNFDCDNDVDLNDLGTLATNFDAGRAGALAQFEALVPEPTGGAGLLTLGWLSSGRRRSRQ
jgi:hypothetical protein